MIDHLEFAKQLRALVRRADTFGHDRKRVLENIIELAETHEQVAEKIELDFIVEAQKAGAL